MEATALNRADVVQRKGHYPPPKGVTDILGLECAGYLLDDASQLDDGSYKNGKRVMAILPGGGYSTVVKAKKGEVMEIPANLTFEEAAAIPETWVTAYQLLHWLGKVRRDEYVLVHAGASGVGTSALQLAREAGAKAIAVCSTDEKIKACLGLGAVAGINYKKNKLFSKEVKAITKGRGANVILDCVFGSHYEENVKSLADEGRWIVYAFMGGAKVQNMRAPDLFAKKATVTFSTMRMRVGDYRDRLVSGFTRDVLGGFADGKLKPVIDKVFPMSQVAEAHKHMESNANIGKIVLRNDL